MRFEQLKKQLQLIQVGLIAGMTIFAVIVWNVRLQIEKVPVEREVMLGIGTSVSLLGILAAFALPVVLAPKLHALEPGHRARSMVATRLMMSAMVEGGGLLWATFALILAEPIYLAGTGVAVAVLVALFPTHGRIEEALGMSEAELDRALEEPRARAARE